MDASSCASARSSSIVHRLRDDLTSSPESPRRCLLPLILALARRGGAAAGHRPRLAVRGPARRVRSSARWASRSASAARATTPADWFQQADLNHDGFLTVGRDGSPTPQRFFRTLDTNHDGEIDPDEVTHYETVVAPEVHANRLRCMRPSPTAMPTPAVPFRTPATMAAIFRSVLARWTAGRRPLRLLNIPEPVAAADADFNRGISPDEFGKAAFDASSFSTPPTRAA